MSRPRIGLLQNTDTPIVDAYLREYPIPYSTTFEIEVNATDTRYPLPETNFYQDKYILGMFIRQQNTAGERLSKNGRKLISTKALDAAHMALKQNNTSVIEEHPLAHFVHERGSSEPGTYGQLIIDQGFSMNTSYVRFAAPGLTAANEAIEITFIWVFRNQYCIQ